MERYYHNKTHYVTSRSLIFHFGQESHKRIFFLFVLKDLIKQLLLNGFTTFLK
jgi:hypothetical protein